MKKKIAIIGAGIAGLTLANLIKKNSDFEFMLYEKADNLSLEEGFGIQLATNSVSILNKNCKYFNSSKKIKTSKYKMIKSKNYDVFCYINEKRQIALTKKNNLGFLNRFNLPEIREAKNNMITMDWKFLKKYKNSISNKKLNINLYYKFSNKIPPSFIWYSIDQNKEFIPTFTKKIFRQVSILF